MENTNNKDFWNDYVTYWENKVGEANQSAQAKDRTGDDSLLENYFLKLGVLPEERFLDYGCGFGRCYPIYRKGVNGEADGYYGMDVSSVSLARCAENYPELKAAGRLIESDGMSVPFEDNSFDKILCWGVFDACFQEIVIEELMRALKVGGRLLLTGKNDNYYKDDEAALTAEANAYRKKHPNYFTDVHSLTGQLLEHNAKLLETDFFLRRGDFARNEAVREMPEVFYEWAYLIEKTVAYKGSAYRKFSGERSKASK